MAARSRAQHPLRRLRWASFGTLAAIGCLVSAAPAEEQPDPRAQETAPVVGLDALLRLPDASDASGTPGVNASDRRRWEDRFRAAHAEVAKTRAELAGHQRELEEMASRSDNWQITAPGAQVDAENSPLSYKLRQEIREDREEVERAERRLRELEVEASLAGVPAEWREPAPETEPDS